MNISIDEAQPGMRLMKPIRLPGGEGVIGDGEPISGETISRLRRAGISRINVIDQTDDPQDAPVSPDKTKTSDSSPPGTHGRLPPVITVTVSDDGMSAAVTVEPAGPSSAELDEEGLLDELQRANVTFGINRQNIAEIVGKWNRARKAATFEGVARGILSQPGTEGTFQMQVRHLSSLHDLEILQQSTYSWQVEETLGTMQRICPGMIVAEKMFDSPATPGVNVFGQPVLSEEAAVASHTALAEGVAFSSDRRQVVAQLDGICYCINETIGIFPLDFNGSIELVISHDKMSAQLVMHPPGEGGSMPGKNAIENMLSNNLVTTGVFSDVIERLVRGFEEGEVPREPVIIVAGTPPVNGRKGQVEFLFNTVTSLAPKINPDGSADYKEIDIVVSVVKGKRLARLLNPTTGVTGITIFGEDIPATDGEPTVMPMGAGTEIDPENPEILLAAIDGIVRWTGTLVEVSEGYVINGNIDYSTGHIRYNKSVIINGDVKTGFNIDCGGDLQVSGIIEDSRVNVGGSILVKHGFVGHGQGVIDAKGDVNVGFVLNQTIKSRKSINVAKEVLNSTLYARQTITIHGRPLSVAGGTLVARESIKVYQVGNHTGVRTDMEVGMDFTLLEELRKTESQEVELGLKTEKLLEPITKYRHRTARNKRLSEGEELLYNKLKIAYAKVEEQKRLLEKRRELIKTKLHQLANAHIRIEHGAMPGTHFKLGERRHFLKEEVIGPKTVRLSDQEIAIQ